VSVYKPCDIRGPVSELSPELYRRWGRSLGRRLEPGARFVVGGDVRATTPAFTAALIEGLCEQGMNVLDLGIVPAPMVYFARWSREARACAIVTASHHPPDNNGLKWTIGNQPPTEDDVLALEHDAVAEQDVGPRPPSGRHVRADITEEYGQWLQSVFGKQGQSRLAHGRARLGQSLFSVVVDPGNGCWSGRAVRHLTQVFPDAGFLAIHDEPDGTFPNRNADCSKPQYLTRLSETVRERGAALGIAFDGDGDRVAFVDDEGVGLSAEEATYILLHSLGGELGGRAFVHDIKFSDRIAETAGRLGGIPITERSGHAFIRTRMIETRALFGAEISGHYFYGALHGGDDGLYTACRMLVHLAGRGESLTALRKECPPVHMTPDLRLRVTAEDHQRLIEDVKDAFQDRPQTLVDGVRIDFPDGWALIRSSVTEPALTLRFEAASDTGLDQLVRRFCERVPGLGEKLLDQYESTRA